MDEDEVAFDPRAMDADQQAYEEDERHRCAEALARVRSGMASADDAEVLGRNLRV